MKEEAYKKIHEILGLRYYGSPTSIQIEKHKLYGFFVHIKFGNNGVAFSVSDNKKAKIEELLTLNKGLKQCISRLPPHF